jgi:hypothetical protein
MQADTEVTLSSSVPRAAWRREIGERAIFWLFMGGLAWVPFWYGSNDWLAWGVNAIIFPGLAALYELWLLSCGKRHPIGARYLALPALLFAGVISWVFFQTLTWSWSPFDNPIWGMAADALGRQVAGSISVNRDLTNLALIRLITAASTFWLALQLCRNGERARLFLGSLGVIACVYAAYGLIALKAGPFPWLEYLPSGTGYVSSTFINRDNYATYAGVGFIVMVGLALRRYRDEISDAAGSPRLLIASVIEGSGGSGAALLAGGFLTLVALLLTGSRGGLFSTGLALFVLIIRGRQRESDRGREHLALILFAFLLVAATLLAFGGAIASKIEEGGLYDASRLAVYLLALRSIVNVPLLGYGYGTFVDVFPMYRDRSIDVWGAWAQAHDTYLELFQGLGLLFGSMLIGCVVLLVIRCIGGTARRRQDATVPRVAASVAVLVGVHALMDFSLQMQAVAVTVMAILGAGVAQSESSRAALED